MKKTGLIVLLSLILMGTTCQVRQDTSILSAAQANDITIIFSGCSEAYRAGILLCRSAEGANQTTKLTLHMPKLNCKRDSCATFDVVRKDGNIYPLGSILKGETSLTVSLAQVTGSTEPMDPGFGGPYRILSEAYYEHEGEEFKVLAMGIVYLLVLKTGYVSLGCDSPDMAWSEEIGPKCIAQYSSKMRTALCGEGCK